MNSTAAPTVILEIRDEIARLTLARPEAANTMNLQFGREFLACAQAIGAARARAVILTGQGKNFCFGGDLKDMIASGADAQAYLSELTTHLHAGMAFLASLDAPVIAAVNGTAAGAGLGLVLAADLVIAARSARFAPAYLGVGLTPDVGCTFLLPRAIGSKRAMHMLLTNLVLDAQQALAWGLVNEVVEDGELERTADALAARIGKGPLGAYGKLKRLLGESQAGFESQLARESRTISAQGATPEGREGIAAFLEKRAPRFCR
jgi:2-(1,2-epoxy-1,2-dihydrophenyl)acetyl-CoA isomerase